MADDTPPSKRPPVKMGLRVVARQAGRRVQVLRRTGVDDLAGQGAATVAAGAVARDDAQPHLHGWALLGRSVVGHTVQSS